MLPVLVLTIIVSFFTVFFLTPNTKKFLERLEIIGTDQQKPGKPRFATSGGLLVISGLLLGGFFFIALNTFLIKTPIDLSYLLASYCSILIITTIGLLDDINIRPRMSRNKGLKDYRIGLKQWQKPLLTLPAAIPLMSIMAGTSQMSLPIIGVVDLGIIYPLILIPIAVVVVSNATNMLAGMNGLESGLGFVSLFALGSYALYFNRIEAAVIAFAASFSLLAFLRWNWFPAKFLPGDSLTYLVGATYISVVITGNMEKFGIIIFIPWIIEAFLKLRSKFRARSLGDLQNDGTLRAPYEKIYSLTHLVMKIKPMKEWKITTALILFEIVICVLAFAFVL
jgi:UDP-N-acetylglucosamine--dolichyl-phosphate N-acetylglucosaminephosphotransferase